MLRCETNDAKVLVTTEYADNDEMRIILHSSLLDFLNQAKRIESFPDKNCLHNA